MARDRKSFVGIGIHPYMTAIDNTTHGVLDVTFSEEMENDRSFNSISSYRITPLQNTSAVHVIDVERLSGTQVRLSFTGGGSPYLLTIIGLLDVAGNYADPNSLAFQLDFPGIDELLTGDKVFVDTDLGAIELTVSNLSRRRIDDLVVQRTRNLGHSAQVSLISGALRDAGVNRDEQKLKLFKG